MNAREQDWKLLAIQHANYNELGNNFYEHHTSFSTTEQLKMCIKKLRSSTSYNRGTEMSLLQPLSSTNKNHSRQSLSTYDIVKIRTIS